MTTIFLDHIKEIEDHRIIRMIAYPLDEVLLETLVGVLCRADDFGEIELLSQEHLDWLRQFLPFKYGIPQTLEKAFASWVAVLEKEISSVVAIDGKTLRGSKQNIPIKTKM
ncbi:transposase family protein [Alphaproteobacteria bacterium]|nr:transposase family protein [Alphaproteobacteria bacterium]